GASNTSVNDVREIKDEVLFAPNTLKYKVYIIDEVHMLSNSAFNALLKTIEEPPPYLVFIFATTEIHKVPATIRSRCQQFNFRLIPTEKIKEILAKTAEEYAVKAESDALYWIAKEATGSLRDAYTLFDQVLSFSDKDITLEKIRDKLGLVGMDRINEIGEMFASGNAAGALSLTDDALSSGVSIEQFVTDLAEYFRNILFLKLGIQKESVLGMRPDRFSSSVVETFSEEQIEAAIETLLDLYRNLRYSINQRFELELTVSRLARLSSYISTRRMQEEIREMKNSLTRRGDAPVPSGERTRNAARQEAGPAARETMNPVVPGSGGKPDGEAAAKTPGFTFGKAERERLLEALKKEKLALAAVLEKAVSFIPEEGKLTITFENSYSANVVKQDIHLVGEHIQAIIKRPVTIIIRTEETKKTAVQNAEEDTVTDQQVDLVKKIFRGEVVKGDHQ
ncbi:MAG TPA: DNA polymerase III subunit gamma/tau, partial [Spirochaetia bacterium]|nr:DNA polymerase III subunit gamma/tau [Spirochaetia bacterium]